METYNRVCDCDGACLQSRRNVYMGQCDEVKCVEVR
jgi:hypothetical protein